MTEKSEKEAVDVMDIDAPSMDDVENVKRVVEPADLDAPSMDTLDVSRSEIPETDVKIAEPLARPSFKLLTPNDIQLDSTVEGVHSSKLKPIKKMELPTFDTMSDDAFTSVDIRTQMPKLDDDALDSVAWVPGIETKVALKPEVPVKNQEALITPESLRGGAIVTSTELDAKVEIKTEGGPTFLTTKENKVVKSDSIRKPSEALDDLMARATVTATDTETSMGSSIIEPPKSVAKAQLPEVVVNDTVGKDGKVAKTAKKPASKKGTKKTTSKKSSKK